ncbi:MAG: alpha/beta hydrolase-fold protein [Acidobacteriota bacterium]|nr:alpha/beta hydrolase-fold protein [Acidobacteriota bacterium]
MNREYHRWHSPRLGREMELLIQGHAGLPVLVFPTSCGRFYEFEEFGMVHAVAGKLEAGHLQLFCVDSLDAESWYNRGVGPDWRIARHVQYERYIVEEVLPLIRHKNPNPRLIATGCSFGGYHAANIALRHPDLFSGFLSMSGAFDLTSFLDGFYDSNCYFNLPFHYLPNLDDPALHRTLRQNTHVLATGVHDQCWNDNERLAGILRDKGIPHRLDVWGDNAGHDWPWWRDMLSTYL